MTGLFWVLLQLAPPTPAPRSRSAGGETLNSRLPLPRPRRRVMMRASEFWGRPMQIPVYRRYVALLIVVYLALWLVLAIQPHDRHDWLLENALVLAFGLGLWASHKSFVFSREIGRAHV